MESTQLTWHQSIITKSKRNQLHGHQSMVLWFTGLSGSGKSTLSTILEKRLHERQISTYILDGDNVRHGINKNLGFSPEDRTENIRRIGEIAKLFVDAGIITLTAFISPYRKDRDQVRQLFEEHEFIEIYVKCSVEECERRDPKGLYEKARAGKIKNFTGVSAPYEPPVNPEIVIDNEGQSIEASVNQVINYLLKKKFIN